MISKIDANKRAEDIAKMPHTIKVYNLKQTYLGWLYMDAEDLAFFVSEYHLMTYTRRKSASSAEFEWCCNLSKSTYDFMMGFLMARHGIKIKK